MIIIISNSSINNLEYFFLNTEILVLFNQSFWYEYCLKKKIHWHDIGQTLDN